MKATSLTIHAGRASHMVGLREKIGYGLGDFASNLIWATTLTYIVFFYTDIYRIPPAYVAAILLVCRIANAVIDPVIGLAIDRRHGREKARPFLKWGAAPLAVATLLVFVPVGEAVGVKVAWAIGTFLLLSITYSFVNTAYGMLTNLMTTDTVGRLKLASARIIGANVGSVLIGWITLSGVALLGQGDQRQGFMLFMGATGVTAALCFLITHRMCRETVHYDAVPVTGGSGALARALLRNRPWLVLTLIKFLNSTANTLSLGSATFAAVHVLGLGAGFGGTLIAVLTASSFAGCWLATPVGRRLGSRAAVRVTNLAQAACFFALAFVPQTEVPVLALVAMIGLLIGMRDPVTYTMLSDTLDYGMARTGVNAMGLGYSIASAAYKVAAGIGGALSAGLLASSGYVAGAAVQPDSAKAAIVMGFALLPGALLLCSCLVTWAYPPDAEIEHRKSFVARE
ncbi:hypothetical protein CLG96_16540 [Sphingomonas oleivorans]|uniref:MFS transporter n=1 Tax=Sphingomonas oleivorans TaxID=1735121 RepID=A0A2T5FU09_9SPHN|nr:glycoside-pentoside-hexuronide (GPH):cation symporter [Sphingomonas oleivorans]PTQ07761.1 hypothetical protein CLG96_16540 [Sphingomonas oleivorans]